MTCCLGKGLRMRGLLVHGAWKLIRRILFLCHANCALTRAFVLGIPSNVTGGWELLRGSWFDVLSKPRA